jgi:hypothetical protein
LSLACRHNRKTMAVSLYRVQCEIFNRAEVFDVTGNKRRAGGNRGGCNSRVRSINFGTPPEGAGPAFV